MPGPSLPIFRYIDALDAFVIDPTFQRVSDELGLTEWHAAVWVCRLLCMDNDVGEHLFDNWDERDALSNRAASLGIDSHDLLIIVPEKLQDGRDGPCNSSDFRKRFWTDVLKSISLSIDVLADKAREQNALASLDDADVHIADLEERIERVRAEFNR